MIFLLFGLFARLPTSKALFQVAVSTELYGPDGPWQAVQVGIGTPPQTVNLYPGAIGESQILSVEACKYFPDAVCGTAGLFNVSESDSYDGESLAAYHPASVSNLQISSVLDTLTLMPAAGSSEGKIEVSSFSISLLNLDNGTYADNSGNFPSQTGFLALGPSPFETFGEMQGVSPAVNATQIPGILQYNGVINSTSYGLHYGSGAMNLPLSLWLGGYDSTRVIGSVYSGSVTNNEFQIELLDIATGVDNGASPFPLTSTQGVLPNINPSTVKIDPATPFIQFPSSICDLLTRDLPVIFSSRYLLYLWNTSDPRYTKIFTSPAYLSFSFQAPALNQGNLTIKVPFRLLNLTLSLPVAPRPLAYFPCMPLDSLPMPVLGRAFLQAAFLGADWSKEPAHEWYLAQAPGPNIATSSSPIAFGGNMTTGALDWSETWRGHWSLLDNGTSEQDTALPSRTVLSPSLVSTLASTVTTLPSKATQLPSRATLLPSSATPSSSISTSGHLSIAAVIGITTGSISFVAFILSAIVVFRHWRHHRQKGLGSQQGVKGQTYQRRPALDPRAPYALTRPGIYEAPMPDVIELSTHPGLSHELAPDSELYEAPPSFSFGSLRL